jgi:hypothetical protein
MLSVIMLNVVMMNVVMLSVVTPQVSYLRVGSLHGTAFDLDGKLARADGSDEECQPFANIIKPFTHVIMPLSLLPRSKSYRNTPIVV